MTITKKRLALAGAVIAALGMPGAFAQDAADAPPAIMGAVSQEIAMDADQDGMPDIAELAAALDAPDSGIFLALQGEPPFPPGPPAPMDAHVQVHDGPPGPGGPEGPGGPGEWRHHHHGGPGGPGGPGCCGPGGGGHGPLGMLKGPLSLSDDQWEKLYAIKNSSSDSIAPKKLAMHQSMRELMNALAAENQDSGRIKSLQNQLASLRADLSNSETNKLIAMSQVLTPEQRKAIHMGMVRRSLSGGWKHGHGHH